MIQFDKLNEVTVVNSRTNYDLRYSSTMEKFNLSQVAYDKWDINNNGFKLLKDSDGTPVLKLVPNEEATIHAGRAGAEQKGVQFTARTLASFLGVEDEDAHFSFEEHNHEGETYLTMNQIGGDTEDASEEVESITRNEETAVEDTQEETVETDRF